jgi:hypothetical protein
MQQAHRAAVQQRDVYCFSEARQYIRHAGVKTYSINPITSIFRPPFDFAQGGFLLRQIIMIVFLQIEFPLSSYS